MKHLFLSILCAFGIHLEPITRYNWGIICAHCGKTIELFTHATPK